MSREPRDRRGGDVGDRFAHRHAARRRRIDQRERRALAHRHRFAGVAGEIHQRHRDIGHRNLPRADHRVAGAQPADGAVADRDEKRLVGDGRQLQHAVRRLLDGDALEIERRQRARLMRDVACHLRRLAEQHVEIHVDGPVAEMRIGDDELPLRRRPADDRARATLARADRLEAVEVGGANRQHVALLRLVAPDLARRHPRLFGRNRAQVERAAGAAAVDQFGQRVGQSAGADVVQRQDRIRRAQLPAAVDHLLHAALDLGVAALDRIEVEIGGVGAGRHRRGRTTSHPDQHPRTTQLDQQRAIRNRGLVRVRGADVAHAARDHDRLVVAPDFARDGLLERAKVAEDVGTAEFIVERCAANRAFEHDRERRGDAIGLPVGGLPWLRERRDAQMRHRKAGESGLRLRPDAGRAFVADLAAGARRRARKRRDRGRMIVRLDLHQDVR